jgi:hypothetical protein
MNITIDTSDIKDFAEKMGYISDEVKNGFFDKILNRLGGETLRKVKKKTPVREGTLKKNWGISEVEHNGDTWQFSVYNNTKYAPYVEYGHRQTPGRYVPAIGKKLVKRWVNGKFMLRDTMKEIEPEVKPYLEAQIEKLFGGIGQ